MAKSKFTGQYSDGKNSYSLALIVYLWEEDGIWFAYSPSLDLTGYGKSENEAQDSFGITLGEFLAYTSNKNTFYDELENLGWTTNRKKKKIRAPRMVDLLEENDSFKDIVNKGGVKRVERNVEFAL